MRIILLTLVFVRCQLSDIYVLCRVISPSSEGSKTPRFCKLLWEILVFVQIGMVNIIQPTDITCIVISDLEPHISQLGAWRTSS
jgi:hypothetical protein